MNVRLLIDSIVRQTTVLIAELSTTAGARAPLAHVADQVFLDLAREIEAQGVGRKVVADMFGLALRSYQKKMHRLTESTLEQQRTLWQAVLGFLGDGSKPRKRILERFQHDGEKEVGAVLSDLVSSGLVYATGRGDGAIYGLTSDRDRASLSADEDLAALANVAWLKIFLAEARCEAELAGLLKVDTKTVSRAVAQLVADARVTRDEDGTLHSTNVVIGLGAVAGWEAAVIDHFRAVATAIAAKARGQTRSAAGDEVGGQTFSFSVYEGHPHEAEVRSLLAKYRAPIDELWRRVAEHNERHPVPDDAARVTFYLGQTITEGGAPP